MSEFKKIAFRLNDGRIQETMMPLDKVEKIIDQMGSENCWIIN
jgi:hypothetical protein